MNLLVLTSKDHPYANLLLKAVFASGVAAEFRVLVLEQDCIIPGKSKVGGIIRYLRASGARYVFFQILKQYVFLIRRFFDRLTRNKASPFYPYWLLSPRVTQRHAVSTIYTSRIQDEIRVFSPDVILSAYSKEILSPGFLQMAKYGCINLHPSLLPEYKGVSPTFWVLAEGAGQAGVTLHFMDAGIDTGEIIAQESFSTRGFSTEHCLYMHATHLGSKLAIDALRKISAGLRPDAIMPVSSNDGYRSLPTREAVKRFLGRGYSFFRLSEFVRPDLSGGHQTHP